MTGLDELKVKLFADGADKASMLEMSARAEIKGLTTNPTLMNKAGIKDYRKFCQEILEEIQAKPISFEVFSDEFIEMKNQALEIASWAANVYVKIPITNTRGESSLPLVSELVKEGVKVNVTAVFTERQVEETAEKLNESIPSYVSVFAGRIADTGVDPVPLMKTSITKLKHLGNCELIWASPRELLNVFQANEIGCHIITATSDILNKLNLVGMDLEQFSLETVKMFQRDAVAAGFKL
jgi:transaldolase